LKRSTQENAHGGEYPKNPPIAPQQSEVDKALAKLNMKMAATEKKEKHKATVVSKLFTEIETPFTKHVIDHPLPNKFKAP
jgi:hypothetical protein